MKTRSKFEIEAMERVELFGRRTDLALTPWLIALFAKVSANLSNVRAWGEGQISGLQTQVAGTRQRRALADEILSRLRDIADVAKAMEEEGKTGMAELFRFPRKPTHEVLVLTAETFAERASGMSADFITRGLPSAFVTDLHEKIAEFRMATSMKNSGRADRSAGTAGLLAGAAEGMKAIRMLRRLMRIHLRSEPALLGAWGLAARVERAGKKTVNVGEPGSADATPLDGRAMAGGQDDGRQEPADGGSTSQPRSRSHSFPGLCVGGNVGRASVRLEGGPRNDLQTRAPVLW